MDPSSLPYPIRVQALHDLDNEQIAMQIPQYCSKVLEQNDDLDGNAMMIPKEGIGKDGWVGRIELHNHSMDR